ncbi:MAG: AbrB/MazE/SpoVT family DNA-binding domain-containing protein [Clostridia bacterium]|nr:AbrB/MazE/SpoVT family DNA-binding domain-containing protein [Clostridia bacterium]
MKATGIVRRIDDLGRVVIPKEIRRTMRIREGDPLEIFTSAGGEVIFKKYSPIGELSTFAAEYAESLASATELSVIICDRDHCVAAAGISKRETIEKAVTSELEALMENRSAFNFQKEKKDFFALQGIEKKVLVANPIISSGDVSGAVVLIESEKANSPTESDIKLVQVAAGFLGKQMED